MRLRLLVLFCAAVVSIAALGGGAGQAAGPSCNRTKDVTMGDKPDGDLFFSRSRVTIRQGSCVRWTWAGELEHELEGKNLNSPVRAAPYRFKKRYSRARESAYRVICTIHPLSMRMRVKVLPPRSS